MAETRSYTAGNFMLDLDGSAAYCKSVDGGVAKVEVVTHAQGPNMLEKKHPATTGWDPFKCKIGLGMAKVFTEWFQATLDCNHMRKNGSITACDANYKAKHAREFFDALITSVSFPAADASSKEGCYVDLEFQAEVVKNKKTSDEKVDGKIAKEQKKFLCSNFRFEMSGIEATSYKKVDAINFKQTIHKEETGVAKTPSLVACGIKVSDLKITLSRREAAAYEDWYESFIMQGKNGDEFEKTATLTFLDQDMKTEIFALEMGNVGIKSCTYPAAEANKEGAADMVVDCYMESIKILPLIIT